MGGPYDEAGRRCFLTGVLAGSPVEFATLGAGTEGGGIVRLYRYAGTNFHQFLLWDKDSAFDFAKRSIFQNADKNVLMRRTLALPNRRAQYLDANHHSRRARPAQLAHGCLDRK